MSTILQQFLESQFFESSTLLKLKLSKQTNTKHITMESIENNDKCSHPMQNDLSFHQALSNTSPLPKEPLDKDNVYVHPLAKRSKSAKLTQESLQLCTENLGSETGTDILDNSKMYVHCYEWDSSIDSMVIPLPQLSHSWNISLSYDDSEKENSTRISCKLQVDDSKKKCRKFPPPLSTMTGASSFRVKHHRKDGRLVMEAIETPLRQSYFQAERSHGRLRLCFLNDKAPDIDYLLVMSPDESDIENNCNDEDKLEKNEEFGRICRCNKADHSDKGLCKWEPLWVATS